MSMYNKNYFELQFQDISMKKKKERKKRKETKVFNLFKTKMVRRNWFWKQFTSDFAFLPVSCFQSFSCAKKEAWKQHWNLWNCTLIVISHEVLQKH